MNDEPNRCSADSPLVEGAPVLCRTCNASLCLRKQVLNLALGNTDEMYCLQCLAKENDQTPAEVLKTLIPYIHQRDCFRKEWLRYLTVEYCPDPEQCLPSVCFDCKGT